MKRITPGQMIILSFATMIFIGACLLMLPFSTNDGKGAPFLDALFTSTSASCVTGLIMHDTAQYWSPFGQLIILILIQIGGMGVLDEGRQAGGGGTHGGTGGTGNKTVLDVSGAKSRNEAYEAITNHLLAQGLTIGSADFDAAMTQAWKDNNISSLPETA